MNTVCIYPTKDKNQLKIAQLYFVTLLLKTYDTDDHQNGSKKSIKQMFCEKNSVQSNRKQQEQFNCYITSIYTITINNKFSIIFNDIFHHNRPN